MRETTPFKERIDSTVIQQLSVALSDGFAREGFSFDGPRFLADALENLEQRELKERASQVAGAIQAAIPKASPEVWARAILHASGAPLGPEEGVSSRFGCWPLLTWVEHHMCGYPDIALPLLRDLTLRFSAEFAVRPFLLAHPKQTWATIFAWSADPHPHVRRLASECTRPRLPWATQLPACRTDPSQNLELLHVLIDDEDAWVRRSVSNHLGDIAKDHPSRTIQTAARWLEEQPHREAVIRNGLRHLLKHGNPEALALLGHSPSQPHLTRFSVEPAVAQVGDTVRFSVALHNQASTSSSWLLAIGVLDPPSAAKQRCKKYAWGRRSVDAGQTLVFQRTLTLRPTTTRGLRMGLHAVDLYVNGQVLGRCTFLLRESVPAEMPESVPLGRPTDAETAAIQHRHPPP